MKQIFTFLLFSFLASGFLNAQIVINEIYYNADGFDDSDFIEFYNNSGADIQMEGYYILDGFDYVFPNYNFEAGTYLVITSDSLTLLEDFGATGLQWDGDAGSLSSGGEDISLYSADSMLVDYVDYDDGSPWSVLADGRGLSLSLCDVNADNEDPANWQATSDGAPTGTQVGRTQVYVTPGVASNCASGPIVAASRYRHDIIENLVTDTIGIFFYLNNANGMPSTLEISVDPSSTASPDEYEILQTTIEYNGMGDTVIIIDVVPGVDDATPEGVESLVLNVTATDNVDRLLTEKVYINLYDDDLTTSESLIIAGVFNADITGGADEHGVELFALKDIPDLSVFGVGTANNGGGTDGIEIPLPAVSLTAGDRFFISDSDVRFSNFFGISPNYSGNPSIWVTGNDAIELFENGIVIDTYGQIDVDGETEPWFYEQGWAVRLPQTLPGGSVFTVTDWIITTPGSLISDLNATASDPYPLNFYSAPVGINDLLSAIDIKISPNPVKDLLQINFDLNNDNIEIQNVSIYSIEGRLMSHNKLSNGQSTVSIDVADLASGMYFATIKTSKGDVTSKFVK